MLIGLDSWLVDSMWEHLKMQSRSHLVGFLDIKSFSYLVGGMDSESQPPPPPPPALPELCTCYLTVNN